VLVLIEYTYFYKLSDYDFNKAFTLQRILVKMLILIPVWTIVPKMEQNLSLQIISLQIAKKLAKYVITFSIVSTLDKRSIYNGVVFC